MLARERSRVEYFNTINNNNKSNLLITYNQEDYILIHMVNYGL